MKFIINVKEFVFLCGSFIQDDCHPPPDKVQNIGLDGKILKCCPLDTFEKDDHHHSICSYRKMNEQISKQLNI
jgi:hypothetical protein